MGIFTRPKDYLDPDLFGDLKELKESVRSKMLSWIYSVIPKEQVHRIFIIGSAIGYKWEPNSDIDINVVLSEDSGGTEYWHPIVKKSNEFILEGTRHPMNIFVQNYHNPDWNSAAFGVYDLDNMKWTKESPPPDSLPNPFKTNRIDIIFAKKRMRQVDLIVKNLKEAHRQKDIPATQQYLIDLANIYKTLDTDRKLAYRMGWGTPRYSAENIVYKYLSHKGYLEVIESIYETIHNN